MVVNFKEQIILSRMEELAKPILRDLFDKGYTQTEAYIAIMAQVESLKLQAQLEIA